MIRTLIFSLGFLSTHALAGPDLICSEITNGQTYGVVGDYQSYSFGDVTCNVGDAPFTYVDSSPDHPVFTSSLYRIQDGRFEQIGLSYVSHTFFPIQGNACGLGCTPGTPGMLGVGCSDTIGAGLAGGQSGMGPRIEIDPWSGDFPYPFSTINQSGNAVYKRLKARIADLSDTSSLYFVERQYISNEEAPDARDNNTSYRRVMFTPGSNSPQLLSGTISGYPVISAWRDNGQGPGMPDPNIMISSSHLAGDGQVVVGSRATSLGHQMWRYDYAVQNINAARGINALRIPIGFNRSATDPYFHDVEYIDEVDNQIDGTDWGFSVVSGFASWETGASFDQNPLANAIRWGTTYSFSFVSNQPPVEKHAELGVFDDDGSGPITVSVVAPLAGPCLADMNADGALNFFDISTWINSFNGGDLNADFTGDGVFDFFDASAFLNAYVQGCM